MGVRSLGNALASFRNKFGTTGLEAVNPPPFSASGGTKIVSGSNTYHVFTVDTPSPQSSLVVVNGSRSVEVLVVAGGAGGANQHGGGGGAGGVLHHPGFTVSDGTYPVTVGAGGAPGLSGPGPKNGTGTYSGSGGNSYFGPPSTPNGFTADGGGGAFPLGRSGSGGVQPLVYQNAPPGSNPYQGAGLPGGSGGGTGDEPGKPGGAPTQNPMNGATGYGNEGGASSGPPTYNSSGGGGAGNQGQSGHPSNGNGGDGRPFSNFPAPVLAPAIPSPNRSAWSAAVTVPGLFAGGGGRGSEGPTSNSDSNGPGNGGPGGGGNGGPGGNPGTAGSPGVYGTGGGGGGSSGMAADGGSGGSGIVILKYTQ